MFAARRPTCRRATPALKAEHEDRTVASIVARTDTIKVTMRDPNVAWHSRARVRHERPRLGAAKYVSREDAATGEESRTPGAILSAQKRNSEG